MDSKYLLKKEFLNPVRYEELLIQAEHYESLFKSWLITITKHYRGPNKPSILLTSSTLSIDSNIDSIAEKMQNLIYPFVHSLYDVSTQHLNYVSQTMRQSTSNSFRKETEKIISHCNKFSTNLANFENIFKEMIEAEKSLIINPTKDIEYFFSENWKKRKLAFERYSKSMGELLTKDTNTEHLYKESETLEAELLEFRKRLINHKYGYLKQSVRMSRKLLSCLSEYLSIGNQMLTKINSKLKENVTSELRKSRSFIEENGNLTGYHENFGLRVQAYRDTLINIQSMFTSNQDIMDSKKLIQELNEAYNGNEQLLWEIFDVFNLFEALAVKKKVMVDRVNTAIEKLEDEYKGNKKAVEVLTTLNRHSSSLQSSERLRKSEILKPEITNDVISKSLHEQMESSLETFREMSRLCLKVSEKVTELKNTENNMSVSYEYKEIKVSKKRPSKKEMWLWKDWREFHPIESVKPKYDEIFISKEIEKVHNALAEDDFEMKVSCSIEGRYSCAARMFIYSEKIKIENKKDEKICFLLPFFEMESIEVAKKRILIKMKGGAELTVSGIKNIYEVESKINEFLQKIDQVAEVNGGEPAKQAIEVSPEELEFLQKRSDDIESQREKVELYTKYGETTLTNVSIQEVYECVFSDKGSSPLNKNISFFEYTNTKNKNFNFKEEKYDKPGPYFYTADNQEVTFLNAPIYSSRTTELDHPLPPIHFLPKSCHCKSSERMYWVSNKELDFRCEVKSTGTEMMESFLTTTLYKLKEVSEKNVSLEMYCKIDFVKETRMKGILLNGAIGEIKKLIPSIILEIEKCMRVHIKNRNSLGAQRNGLIKTVAVEEEEIGEEDEKVVKSEEKEKFVVNRYVIMFVLGTIILNVFINMLF